MNLTNKQLEVLKRTILNKVQESITKFKESKHYYLKCKELEESQKVKDAQLMAKTINSLIKQKQELENIIDKTQKELKILISSHKYDYHPENDVNQWIENEKNKILIELFPTTEEIESDIVIAAMGNDADIIKSILTKYNL